MDVWQESVRSVRDRREPRPVQKHSIHQPHKPQIKKLVKKHFFMSLVCAEAKLVYNKEIQSGFNKMKAWFNHKAN